MIIMIRVFVCSALPASPFLLLLAVCFYRFVQMQSKLFVISLASQKLQIASKDKLIFWEKFWGL